MEDQSGLIFMRKGKGEGRGPPLSGPEASTWATSSYPIPASSPGSSWEGGRLTGELLLKLPDQSCCLLLLLGLLKPLALELGGNGKWKIELPPSTSFLTHTPPRVLCLASQHYPITHCSFLAQAACVPAHPVLPSLSLQLSSAAATWGWDWGWGWGGAACCCCCWCGC